jgi:Family of unknown function (DUF6364)
MSDAGKKRKRPKNLLLDPDAVDRGERYSQRHGISLSRLVGDFLRSLPTGAERSTLTPAVRRLWGIARGDERGLEAYRRHLTRKYGSR